LPPWEPAGATWASEAATLDSRDLGKRTKLAGASEPERVHRFGSRLFAGGCVLGAAVALVAAWSGGAGDASAAQFASQNSLAAISCVAAADCMAVGQIAAGGNVLPLAEVLRDGSWVALPVAAEGRSSQLLGVSCVSAAFCIAVGDQHNGGALSEIWRGRRWIRETVRPSPRASTLESISCVAERFCVAVGATTQNQPLIELWNGRKWSRMASPGSSEGTAAPLHSVSCASRSSCVAVGTAFSRDGQSAHVEHYDDGSWRAVHAQLTGEAPTLTSVSCPAAGWCIAVGTIEAAGANTKTPLALAINGGEVSQMNVAAAPTAGFSGISCAEVDSCVAVGDVQAAEQPSEGSTGSSGVSSGGAGASTGSTSAATGSTGAATGSTGASAGSTGTTGATTELAPFAESLSGGLWQVLMPASEGSSDTLAGGVSCATSSSCDAVGYYVEASSGHISASADELAGPAWTALAAPTNPS
jgi:hypothetical protein